MIVIHKNQLYQLEMSFALFESFKRTSPNYEVELVQLTNSTYKQQITAFIGEVEDYSVARNLQALAN